MAEREESRCKASKPKRIPRNCEGFFLCCSECSHGVEDGEHGDTHVGEDGEPHRGETEGCEDQHSHLDADGKPHVLAGNPQRAASNADG